MLKMNNVTYEYDKDNIALKNINIDLSKGNIIGIIGANGSGKSTLFMNFAGILKPTYGEILYKGKHLKYNKKSLYELRKDIGIVFQDPDKQIFYSNVYDDIAFALRNIGLDEDTIKTRVNNALLGVDGFEFKDKPVHFLSYGQKKRVAIASVLAMQNNIILFDEPTAGLDPISTKSIVNILKDIYNRGRKVVISSHDMDLIYEICDYVYVLTRGSIIDEGTIDEIFLKDDILKQAGLGQPWLVKVHKNMKLPLFRNEEDLYRYWDKINVDVLI
ncbi:MAG TPA: ATP-binding cassette domain-containing protein [Peptostreptococcaceae bacterium]|nr:ATP-binding cassette domain-containing protein [Peptostreptococcaceae bacterium]